MPDFVVFLISCLLASTCFFVKQSDLWFAKSPLFLDCLPRRYALLAHCLGADLLLALAPNGDGSVAQEEERRRARTTGPGRPRWQDGRPTVESQTDSTREIPILKLNPSNVT